MHHHSDPTSDQPAKKPLHDATTASHAPSPARADPSEGALPKGAVFGHYTIEDVLGAGGMGVVYRARQDRPAREVALKVIRPGFASAQALRRFELEAEVLGRLQHPGIAQVYEAGTGPGGPSGGQPFFAMELVRGEPLTRFAEARQLSTRARLELFSRVCDAVQHAHTKGVIHRDLKPGNILVDASGQPRILDFGVARLTQHDVQAVTVQTDIGQLIGTVPYMSPEQVEGDPANLDTRSDVYALGVILFELLTGRLPYDLSKKLIHEAARIIKEDEPTRMSSINRTLRGDIETIALKALEKDKSRRYQAASDLGSDVTRFLRDEPIVARPASRSYQLRKFAKRHKALVGGVLAAFILLALGLAGTSWGLIRAEEQRRIAEAHSIRAQAEAANAEQQRRQAEMQTREAESQRQLAERRRGIAEALNRFFLEDPLSQAAPNQRLDPDITLRAVIERTASALESAPPSVAEVDAEIRLVLARFFGRLDETDPRVLRYVDSGVTRAIAAWGDGTLDAAEYIDRAIKPLPLESPRGLALAQRAHTIRASVLGPGHPLTLKSRGEVAWRTNEPTEKPVMFDQSMLSIGAMIRGRGETPEQVERYIIDRLEELERTEARGDFAGADALIDAEVRPFERLPAFANLVTGTLGRWATDLDESRWSRAPMALARVCLRRRIVEDGCESVSAATAMGTYGIVFWQRDQLAEAVACLEESLLRFEAAQVVQSSRWVRCHIAGCLIDSGRSNEASLLLSMVITEAECSASEDYALRRNARMLLSEALLDLSRYAEARHTAGRGLCDHQVDERPDQWMNARLLRSLGRACFHLGRLAEAAEAFEGAISVPRTPGHKTRSDRRKSIEQLVQIYIAWHAAEPGKGYDQKAAEWKAKLDAVQTESGAGP